MKLSELLLNLSLGELSGSSLTDINSPEFHKEQLPKVINAINQGLNYFYSNFPIKQNRIVLQRLEGMSYYPLDSEYAWTVKNDSPKFIMDSQINPFKDDVLQILQVTSMNGVSLPLNDDFAYGSVFTPEYNVILVPDSVVYPQLNITYQASHPVIPLTEPMSSKFPINLPSSYLGALQSYVASLVLMNMGGQERLAEANQFFAKFKTLTEELKLQGIGTVTQSGINIKPMLRGWL